MTALLITTENELCKITYDAPHYKVIREAVGGLCEVVRPQLLQRPYCMMVNDEGLLLGLPRNLLGCCLYGSLIHGVPIVGDVVILKEGYYNGEPDAVGMTSEEAQQLGDQFVRLSMGVVHWAAEDTAGERNDTVEISSGKEAFTGIAGYHA